MKSLLKNISLNVIKNSYSTFSAQAESKFSIRPLHLLEFKKVIKDWARKEGWNPGIHEYLPFYKACHNGQKGLFSSNNQLIASLSAVRYSKDYAFLGIYIVDPNFREQGVGERLAKTVLSELNSCSLMGLNGVRQQVGSYQRKYGFRPFYNNFRFSGIFKSKMYNILEPEDKIKIIGRENLNINQLIDFDANVFSFVRESFLRNWIEMPESYLLAAVEDEKICGYGVVSKCVNGYKIAPFFAKNEKVAKALYDGFYSRFEDKLIQVDIPETNSSAIKLATQLGLYKTLETKRMYKGRSKLIHEQNLNNAHVYSLSSLEIG